MILLIPVQQNSNCLHQRSKVWSCSRFLRCSSGLCPGTCSVCPLYHTPFWSNWTSPDSSLLICWWHAVENLPHHIVLVNLYSPCRNSCTMLECGCPTINWNSMMTKQKQWLRPLRNCPRQYPCQILLQLVLQISCFLKSVITLSVTLDTHLTMKNQVKNLARTANIELRRINSFHHYLSVEATLKLVLAFVMSRLDYCNSLLYGCPQYLMNRLQKVQNNVARLLSLIISHHTYKLSTGF